MLGKTNFQVPPKIEFLKQNLEPNVMELIWWLSDVNAISVISLKNQSNYLMGVIQTTVGVTNESP